LQTGYIYDTRNRYLFATRGRRVDANLSVSPGISDITYYKLNLMLREFFPLGGGYTITSRLNVGYADVFGDTTQLPPGSRFFGGGFESLRAFRESNIGPRDTNTFDADGNLAHSATNYPIGGKLSTFIQTELLLPNFAADDPALPPENTQFSLFVDTGYIYEEPGDFDIKEFRVSAGVAATFLTPIGALRFSFGVPLRYRPTDRTERIQFSVGSVF